MLLGESHMGNVERTFDHQKPGCIMNARLFVLGIVVSFATVAPTMASAFAVVLYERPMTAQEKAMPRLGYRDYPYLRAESVRQIQERYRDAVMPAYVIKVELLDENPLSRRRTIRIYSTREGDIHSLEKKEWLAARRESLPLKVDQKTYRNVESNMRCIDAAGSLYVPGLKWSVHQIEKFESKDGRNTFQVNVRDMSPFRLTHHELVAHVVRWEGAKIKGQDTAIGKVYVGWPVGQDEKIPTFGLAWISGGRYLISVSSNGVPLDEMLRLVGKQYPSSVKFTPAVDQFTWTKADVQYRLDQVAELIAMKEVSSNQFYLAIGRVMRHMKPSELADWATMEIDLDRASQLHQALTKWWGDRRDKVKWDRREGLLVADRNGDYYPAHDDVWHQKRLRLKVPMTAEELAATRQPLIDLLEAMWSKRAKEVTSYMPKAKAVRWARTGKETWVYAGHVWKDGPVRQITFSKPIVKRHASDERFPLRGIFQMSTLDQGATTPKLYEHVYRYDRLMDEWVK